MLACERRLVTAEQLRKPVPERLAVNQCTKCWHLPARVALRIYSRCDAPPVHAVECQKHFELKGLRSRARPLIIEVREHLSERRPVCSYSRCDSQHGSLACSPRSVIPEWIHPIKCSGRIKNILPKVALAASVPDAALHELESVPSFCVIDRNDLYGSL